MVSFKLTEYSLFIRIASAADGTFHENKLMPVSDKAKK